MKFDVEYLAGLEIAEKDGKVRILQVPYRNTPGIVENKVGYSNEVLLALQAQGYEVLNAYPVRAAALGKEEGLWIVYK